MKPLRSLLATGLALAACAFTLRAEVVPILSDTAGAVSVANAGGTAKTLAISPKSIAFIRFATGDTGILPSEVAAARLTIYFAAVTKPGSVSFHNITTAFARCANRFNCDPTCAFDDLGFRAVLPPGQP